MDVNMPVCRGLTRASGMFMLPWLAKLPAATYANVLLNYTCFHFVVK
jgi:hypothetical protein